MSRFGHQYRNLHGLRYMQTHGVLNPAYRDEWVATRLAELAENGKALLDVGAGTGPYRELAQSKGFRYVAHDFAEYVPSTEAQGLQNPTWSLTSLDFVCDILDIPETEQYEVVLCSEVLEHVPDPVASLSKLSRLVSRGGSLLVTVPLLSLMHQAPHWHAAGLSPFFFNYWAPRLGLRVEELTVHGDYIDLMAQEATRSLGAILGRRLQRIASIGARGFLQASRRVIPDDLLSSGGFGVTLRATPTSEVS
jgi:2-polyprenyl-3-methyl-5-hydroxy-6-metoxy-1,4-benzoquinol methylase